MTVRDLIDRLSACDRAATVVALGEEGAVFATTSAAVFAEDDVDYAAIPFPPGTVVLSLAEVER